MFPYVELFRKFSLSTFFLNFLAMKYPPGVVSLLPSDNLNFYKFIYMFFVFLCCLVTVVLALGQHIFTNFHRRVSDLLFYFEGSLNGMLLSSALVVCIFTDGLDTERRHVYLRDIFRFHEQDYG